MRAAIPLLLLAAVAIAVGHGAPPAAAGGCCSKQAPPPPNTVQGNANNAAAAVRDLRQSQAAEVARRAQAVRDDGREIAGSYLATDARLDTAGIKLGRGTMLSDTNLAALRKVAAGTATQGERDLLIAQGITVVPTPQQLAAIEAAKAARERNQSLADYRPLLVPAFEDYERDNEAHGLAENQRLAMQQHNQDHTTGTSGNEYESTSAALAAHEYGAARFYSRFGQGAGV